MSANANAVTKISDDERDAFRRALVSYYTQGPPIADAFDQVQAGLVDRYYRRKKKFPDEIERINRQARREAAEQSAGDRQAADAEAIIFSAELQRRARQALMESLPRLGSIARGEVQVYDLGETDRDGSPKVKRIIAYSRDIVAAARLLQELARGGVLPENYRPPSLEPVADRDEEGPREPMIPVLGIGTDFTRVTAITPDGTEYTAEVRPGVVVDVEAEECC